jgi:hypothetical protein
MKTYLGEPGSVPAPGRNPARPTVVISEDGQQHPLPYVHRFAGDPTWQAPGEVTNPTFEWGSAGAGASDTSASILTNHLGYTPLLNVVEVFKYEVVAALDGDGFQLPEQSVANWCARHAELFHADQVRRVEIIHRLAELGGAAQNLGDRGLRQA